MNSGRPNLTALARKVVLGHGASGNAVSMKPYVVGFKRRGIDAMAVDLPRGVAERAVPVFIKASGRGPQVIGDGRLRYGAQWIALSPIEHRLAAVLADCFGDVVAGDALANAAWPDESSNEGALRVHLTRLRRRLRSLGLEIQNVRGRGYLMEQAPG